MSKKTAISIVSGVSALILAATCLPAMAFGMRGHHRHGGGDMKFAMYAKAAGLTHDQIKTAFQNSNVKADFQTVRKDKKAMDTCIISGACTNEVTTYSTDLQTLTKDKLTVWQTLFASAPNKQAAASLKGQFDSLNAQKHQLMHSVFAKGGSNSPTAQTPQE